MQKIFLQIIPVFLIISSCKEKYCEKHFISKDYIGKVVIQYSTKELNNNKTCHLLNVTTNSDTINSNYHFEEISRYNSDVFQCYEIIHKDSSKYIPVFIVNEYFEDTINNESKKFIFLMSSGFNLIPGSDKKYFLEYYVDYGKNYMNYMGTSDMSGIMYGRNRHR